MTETQVRQANLRAEVLSLPGVDHQEKCIIAARTYQTLESGTRSQFRLRCVL